jgi:FAD/FMN-containing dehydrogenase
VDMSGLAAVLADDPAGETITVEGGCHWLAVAEALHGQGRRPRVLTDNPRTTVAGTLAVGGFGDSSHRDGLQAAQVARLEVLTLDGACHAVGPGDPLFDYTLCGRGQLAVIASATLATQRCPTKLLGRIVRWNSLARFLADAEVACRAGYFDYFRARYRWAGEGPPYYAVVGCLDPAGQAAMQRWEFPGFAPDKVSGPSSTDLMNHLRVDHFEKLQHAAPALEVLFPLAGAAAAIERFVARVREAGLAPWLAHGSSLLVCRCDRRLPLAPFPAGELCALFAMRPRMPEQAASALLPAVRALGRQTLEEGAKLYLMSVDPDGLAPGECLDRAFGSDQHLALAALKARWDPGRLLNPWVL